MKRLTNPVPQFLDNEGELLSGGSIGFYENGSTSIKKNTYNADGGAENLNPLPLTGEGRTPSCWGDGLYTIILRAAPIAPLTSFEDGEIIWVRHGCEFGEGSGQFSDWSPNKRYEINEIVRYSDGLYYISEDNGNLANYPSTATEKWSQIGFLRYWNADKDGGYSVDDIVIKSGKLYRSITDGNVTSPPSAAWEDLTFNDSVLGDFEVGGNLDVIGGITSGWTGVARRITTLSITSDTTLNIDSELSVSGLVSGWYYASGAVVWNANSGGAGNGLKITMDGDATTSLQKIAWVNSPPAAGTPSSSTDISAVFESSSADDNILSFSGMIRLDSGGALSVWVSQNVSSATSIVVKYGTLTVTRVGSL